MSTSIKLPDSFKRRWEQFLAPTLALPEGDQQRARLLTTMIFALLLFLIPLSVIWIAANNGASYSYFVMGVILFMVIMSLSFSRTRYYRWSARCLIMMLLCALALVFAVGYFSGGNHLSLFKYLIFGTFLASLILSLRETIALAVVWFLLIYFICRVIAVPTEPMIINELAFSGVSSILIITSAVIRERYVNQLRTSGHRYRALFEQSNDAVFIIDMKGSYEAVNQRAADMLGYKPDELVNLSYRYVVVPDEMDHAVNIRERLLAGESLPPYERRFRRKDGSEIPVEINIELVCDDTNQPLHFQSIVREITARKKDEATRIQVRFERERSQILANFVRGAAHEFRTPLSVIGANTYLLLRDADPNKKVRRLGVIDQQVDRVSRLVDLMLMMVKLDSSENMIHEAVNLNTALSSIVDSFRDWIDEKALQVTLNLSPDLPPVQGEPVYLGEALRHIVQNAIQYTPENGFISVMTTHNPEGVRISVQDSGIGIAPEQQERIFERFYRTDEAHSTEGFGLGLSIARMVTQRHGGRIEVSSAPGKGSTFIVTLPLDKAAAPAGARG